MFEGSTIYLSTKINFKEIMFFYLYLLILDNESKTFSFNKMKTHMRNKYKVNTTKIFNYIMANIYNITSEVINK